MPPKHHDRCYTIQNQDSLLDLMFVGPHAFCFTTGRGSAFGCVPSPSLKLATNSALWQRQQEDIDINCGEIIDGECSIEAMGERIFEMMIQTASGQASKSELHGYGQSEFVPWQVGAVM